jgi:hypothetical protein
MLLYAMDEIYSRVVRTSDRQFRSRNYPIILRHSGIWGAADETVLNIVHKKVKIPKIPLLLYGSLRQGERNMDAVNATVLGSIPVSSDTVESEGRHMKQCWRKNPKNLPFSLRQPEAGGEEHGEGAPWEQPPASPASQEQGPQNQHRLTCTKGNIQPFIMNKLFSIGVIFCFCLYIRCILQRLHHQTFLQTFTS